MISPTITRRLSSRLTPAIRFAYAAIVAGLAAGAVVSVADGTYVSLAIGWRAALSALLVALAAIVLNLVSFMRVACHEREVRVRGVWREWRIPALLITDVSEREHRGLSVVKVTLSERVPGLGSSFRFIPPFLSQHEGAEAECLRVASQSRPAGA